MGSRAARAKDRRGRAAARLDRDRGAGVPGGGNGRGPQPAAFYAPRARLRGAQGRAVRPAVDGSGSRGRQDAHRAAAAEAGAGADVRPTEDRAPAHRVARRRDGRSAARPPEAPGRDEDGEPDDYTDLGLVFAKEWADVRHAVGDARATAPGEQPRPAGIREAHQGGRRAADQVPRAAAYVRDTVAAGAAAGPRRQRTARAREGEHDDGGLRARPARHAAGRRGDARRVLHGPRPSR